VKFGYVKLTVIEDLYERPLSPRKVGIPRIKRQDNGTTVYGEFKLDATLYDLVK
jgi:hypothetical protein